MPEIHRLDCDLLFFDLDGVLIDSTPCIIRHWREWAALHDLDLDTILAAAHGVRTVETMRRVAPHLDAEAEAARFSAHEVADTAGVTAIAGARSLLAGIPPEAWAIVTSAGAALARARLRQAGLPSPAVIISADDVARGKPDPEPYITGARRLGCPPGRSVVVEDAPAGVAAGIAAGMRVIAVGGTHSRKALLGAGATVATDRLRRLRIAAGTADFRLAIRVQTG
ncbi:MAG: HAD-IA family hydrolase [Desulfosarcinaceae bacterium]|nr:HAD-IA family hydrolase [Desulfosarcinaceae bacterium]